MPNSATPKQKDIARHLVSFESAASESPAEEFVAFRVCEKLRGPLGRLLGLGGFRALLARALALARADHPWLSHLLIEEDGSLAGFAALSTESHSNEFTEGEVALVAQLLGLLVTFIGPSLALGLVRETWPKAPSSI